MALNDKKLEKMVQKSEQLKKRIRNDMEESKKIENEIKVMSYDNIVAEATSHGITLDDNFFDSVSIINELKANGITASELSEFIKALADNKKKSSEGTENEKKLF